MTRRSEQVAERIHRLVGDAFERELEFPDGVLPTISRVDIEPDLKRANVYITVLPFNRSEEVMTYLVRNRKRIQQRVVKELTMKFVPELYFISDSQTESADQIERLIDAEARERAEREAAAGDQPQA